MADSYSYSKAREGKGTLRGGAAAGLLAGCGMALVAMAASAGSGHGFWSFLQQCGAAFYGVDALVGGFMPGLAGLCGLLLASALWGVIFAAMVDEYTSAGSALWSGLVYGTCLWVMRTFITLPLLNTVMHDRVALSSGWWFAENLVYGALLAFTPRLKARWAVPRAAINAGRRERLVPY